MRRYTNGKKRILLLSDDCRMHSGIATVSKNLIFGTLDKYEWVQLGAAIKHPDEGKILDMNQGVRKDTGIKDAYLKIYPVSGYGNPQLLREILQIEEPDAILHFTDPRFWVWLYQMEHEIRSKIPLMYLNIWDDLPTPNYNRDYYRSCDLLMSISKQTYGINKRILSKYGYEDWQTQYVPHGINQEYYFPIHKNSKKSNKKFKEFESKFDLDKYKFKILYVNRNIRRKNPGDVVMAYKHFMDGLTPEQRKECCLIFHTDVSDDNGTDIRAVHEAMCPEYNILFTKEKVKGVVLDDKEMNFLYNSVDVYINIASNEGFGLCSCEALNTGTPIVVNVTGGLQDQCGFKKEDGTYLTADDYVELESNHRGTYKDHGEWVKPVFPSNISLQGSPQTPYIFDDRASYEDTGDALRYWYDKGPDGREEAGKKGSEYVSDKNISMTAKNMCELFSKSIDTTFEKWIPKKQYTLEAV